MSTFNLHVYGLWEERKKEEEERKIHTDTKQTMTLSLRCNHGSDGDITSRHDITMFPLIDSIFVNIYRTFSNLPSEHSRERREPTNERSRPHSNEYSMNLSRRNNQSENGVALWLMTEKNGGGINCSPDNISGFICHLASRHPDALGRASESFERVTKTPRLW